MTQDERDLLLKDLCARLPYGVIVETPKGKGHVCDINLTIFCNEVGVNINPTSRDKFNAEKCKPYLFPLSSMTEEQRVAYEDECFKDLKELAEKIPAAEYHAIDWLNAHLFDFRGLIPMGLANDATGLNIY